MRVTFVIYTYTILKTAAENKPSTSCSWEKIKKLLLLLLLLFLLILIWPTFDLKCYHVIYFYSLYW